MLAATFHVTPETARRFNWDCRGWLEQDEEVLSAEVTVAPTTDPLFYIPTTFRSVTPDEEPAYFNRLVFFASGGKPGETYDVEFLIITSHGQRRPACVRFIVREGCAES